MEYYHLYNTIPVIMEWDTFFVHHGNTWQILIDNMSEHVQRCTYRSINLFKANGCCSSVNPENKPRARFFPVICIFCSGAKYKNNLETPLFCKPSCQNSLTIDQFSHTSNTCMHSSISLISQTLTVFEICCSLVHVNTYKITRVWSDNSLHFMLFSFLNTILLVSHCILLYIRQKC